MTSFYELLTIQALFIGVATFIDGLYNQSGLKRKWIDQCTEWWVSLELLHWPQIIEINEKFYDAFISIYSSRTFSFKRLFASSISSIFFVLCIFYVLLAFHDPESSHANLMIGPKASIIFSNGISYYSFEHILLIAYLAIHFNLIPDLISLAETGLLLKYSRKNKHTLFFLFFTDLLITTFIFIIWNIYMFNFDSTLTEWVGNNSILTLYSWSGSSPLYLSFLISTYATSFLWISFLLTVLVIGFLKRFSNTLKIIFESSAFVSLPVSSLTGMICLLIWPFWLILKYF